MAVDCPPVHEASSVAERMFVVLDACASSRTPLQLVELCALTGLPKTTLHRVCWKLVDLRVLEHTSTGFAIGSRLYALGAMSPRLRPLRTAALPSLHSLAGHSGWVATLAILSDDRALLVDEVSGVAGVSRRADMVDATMPLYASAIGKALLAHGPHELREEVLAQPVLQPFTRFTIVRTSLMADHLQEVRRAGVAFSREECQLGSYGIAAPILRGGELIGAVGLMGPCDESALKAWVVPVRQAAARVAEALEAEQTAPQMTPWRRLASR